ncbi:MAG: DUF2085 domain-containing protein [Anaerolineales bacterium]|nr:DUF2085 domain-containing protein [Anaerolineales bacterium]
MEQALKQTKFQNLLRWFVSIAALLAFAAWFYIAPPSLLGKADAIGYAVCHRIDERSFHIGERQLPLCVRCTGEFNAAAISLIFFAFLSKKKSGMPGWKLGAPLILFFLAFGIDGSNSYLYLLKQTSDGALSALPNLYVPNNVLRLFTGSGMGIALASILFPAFNQTVWQTADPKRALDWKKLAALVGIILLVDLLILTENPFVLYPIAILSALGVLTLLTIVFTMMWLMIMRQENTFHKLSEMWMPFLAGLTLALLMISAIDLLRFNLTGTWGGLPLG